MTRNLSGPQTGQKQSSAAVIDLAYLDVDRGGRIVTRDPVASQFLDMHPCYLCSDDASYFIVPPVTDFLRALKDACDAVQPVSSVLIPYEGDGPKVQVNVLPFRADVVRIVIFWTRTDIEMARQEVPKLSVREQSVLELAAAGLRRDRIGHALNISLPTVDMHCRNLRRKLSAMTTSEAVATAVKMKLLDI